MFDLLPSWPAVAFVVLLVLQLWRGEPPGSAPALALS